MTQKAKSVTLQTYEAKPSKLIPSLCCTFPQIKIE